MVKPKPANGKVGNRGVLAFWKNERIDGGVVSLQAGGLCPKLEGVFPSRAEFQRFRNVEIDALRNKKELGKLPPHKVHGADEIIQQDDIGINVGKYRKTCSRFRLVKQIVEERSAEFVRGDVRNMAQAQSLREFSAAFILAEENDLGLRVELSPALDGVALNYADMACEGLGDRKEGKHVYKDNANERRNAEQTTEELVCIGRDADGPVGGAAEAELHIPNASGVPQMGQGSPAVDEDAPAVVETRWARVGLQPS